ncbi:MAG: exodeoxyribonuclease V subunit alpha [Acidithiobacillus sp.]|uniref:exodeoxyribonuclease V subunit alpha n=1 Tax=Acidithiobacillus sp. TaxID=1872118 RepID=UPI003D01CFC5
MSAPAPNSRRILQLLGDWHQAGWIGPLEPTLAHWLAQRDPDIAPELLFLAAILVHLEGLGHTCLDLSAFLAQPAYYLDWPAEAQEALEDMLRQMGPTADAWHSALARGSRVLAQHPQIAHPQPRHRGPETPLVWDGQRLYLRRHYRDEIEIAGALHARARSIVARFQQGEDILARLFGPVSASTAEDGQRLACALAAERGFTLITGGPGSGKTYTIARLLVLLTQTAELRIALAAPTGKAALRMDTALQQSVDDFVRRGEPELADLLRRVPPAQTLHRLLGARPGTRRLRHDARRPLELDLLIVDEASMIQHELMAALLRALPAQAQLILLGDPDQLASVEAGAVLAEICRGRPVYPPATARDLAARWGITLTASATRDDASALEAAVVRLRSSYRFQGPIAELARAIRVGDVQGSIELLRAHAGAEADSALGWIDPQADGGRERMVELAETAWRSTQVLLEQVPEEATAHDAWVRALLRTVDEFRILCALREGPWGVAGINAVMTAQLRPPGYPGAWYPGRPILVQRNDPIAGVYNGDLGLVLPDAAGRLQVYFARGPQQAPLCLHPQRLGDAATAYALTVHKAQGSEFQRVLLVLPREDSPVLSRELLYTAVTRARRSFLAVTPLEALPRILDRHGRRMSGLATRLFPQLSDP